MAATVRAVDLTDVKEGGSFRPKRKTAGDYRAKIVKADDHTKEGKTPGWVLTVQVEGDARATYPIYLNPDKKQAWKIWQVCRAAGLNVKQARVRFDANRLVGKAIGVALEDDEYEGRLKSTIDECFPVSEVGASADEDAPDIDEDDEVEIPDDQDIEEEEEEEPAPVAKTRRRKPAPAPVVEEEEEEEDEPEEEPEPPKPTRRVARRKPAPEPEPEDEEEEEEPPPRRRRAASTPATKRVAKAPVASDDEDDDLDLDDLDD